MAWKDLHTLRDPSKESRRKKMTIALMERIIALIKMIIALKKMIIALMERKTVMLLRNAVMEEAGPRTLERICIFQRFTEINLVSRIVLFLWIVTCWERALQRV